MGKVCELSVEDRKLVETLHAEGFSSRQIAKRLNVNDRTVGRTLQRLRDTGSHMSRARSGRPRAKSAPPSTTRRAKVSMSVVLYQFYNKILHVNRTLALSLFEVKFVN